MPRLALTLLAVLHVAFTFLSYGFYAADDVGADPLLSSTGDLRAIFHSHPDDENSLSFFRWEHYADFFELNFRHFDWLDRPVRMLEIGVLNGGSPYVWHEFFRRVGLRFVGIDIIPACKVAENLDMGIHIEIGSQSDPAFLRRVCERYGPFDIVVDDGSHRTEDILASFEALWPACMANNGVYVVEDLHAMGMFPNQKLNGVDVFGYMAELMYHRSTYQLVAPAADPEPSVASLQSRAKHVLAMHSYDSMVFLHFRESIAAPRTIVRGRKYPVMPHAR